MTQDFDAHEKALPDEPTFTLLARDPSAPTLLNDWADLRILEVHTGQRPKEDLQMVINARSKAKEMIEWRKNNRDKWKIKIGDSDVSSPYEKLYKYLRRGVLLWYFQDGCRFGYNSKHKDVEFFEFTSFDLVHDMKIIIKSPIGFLSENQIIFVKIPYLFKNENHVGEFAIIYNISFEDNRKIAWLEIENGTFEDNGKTAWIEIENGTDGVF